MKRFRRNNAANSASSKANKRRDDLDVVPVWRVYLQWINLDPISGRLPAIHKACQVTGVTLQRASYIIAHHSPVGVYKRK